MTECQLELCSWALFLAVLGWLSPRGLMSGIAMIAAGALYFDRMPPGLLAFAQVCAP